MSLVTNDFKPPVNTLEEVKKLQDLVRKLEIQNLHLRNKQISNRRKSKSPVKEHALSPNISRSLKSSTDEKRRTDSNKYFDSNLCSMRDEYFDDLDIIKISDIEMSDDESWLYSSPSNFTSNKESSYKWLRKDVDDPQNKQLQLAKKALLTKLDELEILSPLNKLSSHSVENVSNVRRSHVHYKSPLSAHNADAIAIDTRTFTRSKKKQALDFLETLDWLNSERNSDKLFTCMKGSMNKRGSDVSSDSMSSGHVLEDANDVQEVARMQEESLRMNSPLDTPRRGSLNSTCRRISTSRGSVSDQDVSEISVFSIQSTEETEQDIFEKSSYVDQIQHSAHSSPSDSPYGSNMSLHNSGSGTDKLSGYRRSLPNLNRAPKVFHLSNRKTNKMQYSDHASIQYVGRKQNSNREKSPKDHEELLSVTRVRKSSNQVLRRGNVCNESSSNSEPNANVPRNSHSSEPKRQIKSSLPRTARASSASRSNNRSGIPMPSIQSKKHVEDTWSEGCF